MLENSLQTVDRETVNRAPREEDLHAAIVCAACGGTDFRRLFRKAGRDFWKCRRCGMQRQHPLPTLDELKSYYDRSYRDGLYQQFAAASEMKRLTAEARWQAIGIHAPQGHWLDIGCADGTFLAELSRRGVDATGIDLSEVAVDKAVSRGLRAQCQTAGAHVPPAPYDVVSAFDVLEHVLDPCEFLAEVRRLLAPGGTVVLSTPNLRSFSRVMMGRRWYFYIPEEHLYYFAPRSLKQLLQRNGFTLLSCRSIGKPLTFDYSLLQFQQYNPLIYRVLKPIGAVVPPRWRQATLPLHIGEMLAIARRR